MKCVLNVTAALSVLLVGNLSYADCDGRVTSGPGNGFTERNGVCVQEIHAAYPNEPVEIEFELEHYSFADEEVACTAFLWPLEDTENGIRFELATDFRGWPQRRSYAVPASHPLFERPFRVFSVCNRYLRNGRFTEDGPLLNMSFRQRGADLVGGKRTVSPKLSHDAIGIRTYSDRDKTAFDLVR